MTLLTPCAATLVRLMRETPRGPKREGAFALWLTVRVAEDFAQQPPAAERTAKRRVQALAKRLSSLSLPAPLRRALQSALAELEKGRREAGLHVLQQLVAPAREALGSEAGEALARAGRAARSPSTS